MNKNAVTFAAVSIIAFFFASCQDDSPVVTRLEDIEFPANSISFKRHVQPLFNIACAVPGCHTSESKSNAGNIDLSSYQTVWLTPQLVEKGKPELSRLYLSVQAWVTPTGALPMPTTRALPLNQINGIKQWIIEGATDTIP